MSDRNNSTCSNGFVSKKNGAAKLADWPRIMLVYFLLFVPGSGSTLFNKVRSQIFRKCLHAHTHTRTRAHAHTHTHSVFSLIFVHIPLTSLSPTINILPVRLDKSVGFGRFMEKKKVGEVSTDRWGVNGKMGGERELWDFCGG